MVILETTLDEELKDLGFYRELLNRIQGARKELGLEYTDRIRVGVVGSERVRRIAEQHTEELAREALATAVSTAEAPADGWLEELEVEGETVKIGVARAERGG